MTTITNGRRMKMTRKWKVERLVDGEWCMFGVYSANFIEQLAAAIEVLVKAGGEIYKTIRVVEVTDG